MLRDAIRQADTDLPDSWSLRERAQAAARIASHLHQVADIASRAGDRSCEIAAVQQTIELCVLTAQFFDWLVDAAQRLLAFGQWSVFAQDRQDGQTLISALLLGLRGASQRRSGRLDVAIDLTTTALGYPDLPAKLQRFLRLHRGHALRVAGRYADAADDYQSLWQTAGDFSAEAGYWLADHSFLDGRFAKALQALDQLPDQPVEFRGEILRLRGHIYRVNALFSQAESYYRQALDLARQTANTAAEGKALTDLVQTLAWSRPGDAHQLRTAALEANETIGNNIELVKLHAATAITLINLGDLSGAEAEIDRGLVLTDQCGYLGGQVWCWVARALNTLRRADHDGYRTAADKVTAITTELGGNRFWSEIIHWWTTPNQDDDSPTITRWIDGQDTTRQRWTTAARQAAS